MIQGQRVYRDIDQKLDSARSDVDRVGAELKAAWERAESLREAEGRDLAALARVRLEELKARRVVAGLDEVDHRVLGLLDEKAAEEERLQLEIEARDANLRTLEAERTRLVAARDEAMGAHEERVEEVRARVDSTEAWQFQEARVEKVAAQAEHAASKATQAEQDREAKGRPYEQDKLFTYLWKRRYGFPEYKASPLIRTLDGWVARLCRYDRAHLDYRMLLEIPLRLRAHADHLAEQRADEEANLQALLARALEEGGVPALAHELERRERALVEHEARIDAEEKARASLLESRAILEAGEDRFTREALAELKAQLGRETVAALEADAARTTTREDDSLVAKIAGQRAEAQSLSGEIESLRSSQEQAMRRLRDLEELRRRFRHHGYDAADSVFNDDLRVGDVLGELLRGVILVGDAWGKVQRNQRFEARHRTRPSGGGGWSFPTFPSSSRTSGSSPSTSSRRPSGGGFGGSSRSGGGKFRTGGGF